MGRAEAEVGSAAEPTIKEFEKNRENYKFFLSYRKSFKIYDWIKCSL